MPGNSSTVSTKCQRIAELAKRSPEMGFTSLAHHLDMEWLLEAYRRTRKDGAVGVDGQTAAQYAEHLEANLQSLLDRLKSKTYTAPPVRRVHIPKGTGGDTRPIGIPAFEDKILQRAVVMLLEPIYEQDFCACSYGFRPGRSAHLALKSVWNQIMQGGVNQILEVDIQSFFETLDHAHLRKFLERRIRDGVLLRLIGKWLNAGVMEGGSVSYPDSGSPQGGVVSPMLSNVFLHYVLDVWFAEEIKPRLRGRALLVRYADDFIMGFTHEDEARLVLAELSKRFGDYGLTLHPTKTRLVGFRRPPSQGPIPDPEPGTFDLLGFTHYWGKSRNGYWVVKRKTAKGRLSRAIRTITQWCRNWRHSPIKKQHHTLAQKLRGHDAYYGITGNGKSLSDFHYAVTRVWRKWLQRRNRQRRLPWVIFNQWLRRMPLPPPKVVHSVYRS